MKRIAIVSLSILAICGAERLASAAICHHVQSDLLDVDGMLDDWKGLVGRKFRGDRDAGMVVRCAYDSKKLYLSVNVRDERVVRTRKGRVGKEDRITIDLAAGGAAIKIKVLPGSATGKVVKKAPRFVKIADSLQPEGFSVEAAVPLKKIVGWGSGTPYVTSTVGFHDVDQAVPGSTDDVLAFRGRWQFSDAVATFAQFRQTTGLRYRDIVLDELHDVDPGAGVERVVLGKNVLAVLGQSFTYMALPVAKPADVKSLKVVDLDGTGRGALIAELRQFGGGGSRDVVIVYYVEGNGRFLPALAFETRKEADGRVLESTWELVPRGSLRGKKKKAARGFDILVQAGEVKGWDESSFRETPAPDVKPILTPWGEKKSALYYFEGKVAYEEEEPKLSARRR